jgi:hypothetical protein
MIPSVNEFMMMVHTFDNMLDYVDVNARENPTDFTYQIVVRNVKTDYSLYKNIYNVGTYNSFISEIVSLIHEVTTEEE